MVEDGVPRCASLPSSNLVPFGRVAARETVAESLVMLYRVGTHQIRRMNAEGSWIVDGPGEG